MTKFTIKHSIWFKAVAIVIVCLFLSDSSAHDISFKPVHVYKVFQNGNLAAAAKWNNILSPEMGDKGMIDIALTTALTSLFHKDNSLFLSLGRFKKCVQDADERLFNLPQGLQFLFHEAGNMAPGKYFAKCKLTDELAGPVGQKTYYVVFGVSFTETTPAGSISMDVYTESEFNDMLNITEMQAAGDVADLMHLQYFDNVRRLPPAWFRAAICTKELKIIGRETHTIVLSNDDLDYVIKVRNPERDINNSFHHYRRFHERQNEDLALAEYFMIDDLRVSLEGGESYTFESAVIQEKVDILADVIEENFSSGDAYLARGALWGFHSVHYNLAYHGLFDKLFTVAELESSHRRPRRYLLNIGYSRRKRKWVHIDCADLTDMVPEQKVFLDSLRYVNEWFTLKDTGANFARVFGSSILRRTQNLIHSAMHAAQFKYDIREVMREAPLAGADIPINYYKQQKLIVPFEFFGNDHREFSVHKFLYGDRFQLDYVSDRDSTRYVDKVLESADGFQNRAIALVPVGTTEADLERLKKAGVRFLKVDAEALLTARVGDGEYKRVLQFQRNAYAIMMLARRINEVDPESPIYKTLRFFVKTHFWLTGVEAEEYVNAIARDQMPTLVKGVLTFRPIVEYDMPEYYEIAPAITSA